MKQLKILRKKRNSYRCIFGKATKAIRKKFAQFWVLNNIKRKGTIPSNE